MAVVERRFEGFQKPFSRRNFLRAGCALGAGVVLEHALDAVSPVDGKMLDPVTQCPDPLRSAWRRLWRETSVVGNGVDYLSRLDMKKVEAAPPPQDFDFSAPGVSDGHFYTETRGDAPFPKGYAVYNDQDAQFWKRYQELGRENLLGFPISQRFKIDGMTYQATQNFFLQNNSGLGGVVLANLLNIMHDKGYDDWLYKQGIPRPSDDGSGGNQEKSREIRRSYLTDSDIERMYRKNPGVVADWNSEQIYGFADSKPEKRGPFISQRFQRAAILKWVENVPGGQPVGTVQFANVGYLARQAGLIPLEATVPLDMPQGSKIEESRYEVPLVFRKGDPTQQRDYVSVDDGWKGNEKYFELMLNVAKDTGQKLTLFLIGSQMIAYPELVRRAYAEDHELENHTWDHLYLSRYSDAEIRSQIRKQREAMKAILNDPAYGQEFLRPPYGMEFLITIPEFQGSRRKKV